MAAILRNSSSPTKPFHPTSRFAATAGSLGWAGYGGVKGSKAHSAAGLSAAFLSGFARGRANREEKAALGRIKRYYDLREKEPLLAMKKHAVVGGAVELASSVLMAPMGLESLSHLVQHATSNIAGPALSTMIGASVPSGLDLAFLPWLGKKLTQSTRDHAHVAAKDVMGLPLTPDERLLRAKSLSAIAKIKQTEAMPEGPAKAVLNWWDQYKGPKATGGKAGEMAGAALKELHQYSPTLANLGLEAIKTPAGFDKMVKELGERKKTYQEASKILDSTIDVVPGLRPFLKATGRGGQNIVAQVLEHPQTATEMAQKIKESVTRGVRGGKVVAGGALLAMLGAGLGGLRKRHPLSKNDLPIAITEAKKRGTG